MEIWQSVHFNAEAAPGEYLQKKNGINKTQAFDEDKRNYGTLKSSFFHSRSFYVCYEIKHVFA